MIEELDGLRTKHFEPSLKVLSCQAAAVATVSTERANHAPATTIHSVPQNQTAAPPASAFPSKVVMMVATRPEKSPKEPVDPHTSTSDRSGKHLQRVRGDDGQVCKLEEGQYTLEHEPGVRRACDG